MESEETQTLDVAQLPHLVSATWRVDRGEMDPIVRVFCPYELTDHAKPCRVWADEDGLESEDGCRVQDFIECVGWADLYFEMPEGGAEMPFHAYVRDSGWDGFALVHADVWHAERGDSR